MTCACPAPGVCARKGRARSVDVALLEGALAGLGGLGGWVVLAQLRVAVGLGALDQRLLCRILVLWLSLWPQQDS